MAVPPANRFIQRTVSGGTRTLPAFKARKSPDGTTVGWRENAQNPLPEQGHSSLFNIFLDKKSGRIAAKDFQSHYNSKKPARQRQRRICQRDGGSARAKGYNMVRFACSLPLLKFPDYLFFALLLVAGGTVRSDEGMWLLNDPPKDLLAKRHGFDLTQPWLDKARKASIRLNSGGSGSFVSPSGLLLTNHHVGADALAKLSSPGNDLLTTGFLARSQAEEKPCPDLEINVLMNIEDVTDRVEASVKGLADPAKASAARRAEIARIEKESLDKTGFRSDVVVLYQGAMHHLYRYKKYTDVRMVFAPEGAVAGFGGDVDNFEFPRHGLDICLLRAYENGKPIESKDFLKIQPAGPAENDLVFVTGHPGVTQRLETVARLELRRDHLHPFMLGWLRTMENGLTQFAASGAEPARLANKVSNSIANSRKALTGQFMGLCDETLMAAKRKAETELRAQAKFDGPDPFQSIAQACAKQVPIHKDFALLERGMALESDLFTIARHLVRMAREDTIPGPERLKEYRESARSSLELSLFSPAPIHPQLEKIRLTLSLTCLAEQLGATHPLSRKILAGKSPEQRAQELVDGSRLADVQERRRLAQAGQNAVNGSSDSMIVLAKAIDAEARSLRKRLEEEVEEPERQAQRAIGLERFRILGKTMAPDATFTLRLAFGQVKGYSLDGKSLPCHTTFAGLFAKADDHENTPPFKLPKRWVDRKSDLNLQTPFNFASTADTIGGNSGSPVLNRAGELVGVNFDRNRHGLVRNFVYTDLQARHIAVHAAAIVEALDKVYGASEILKELGLR